MHKNILKSLVYIIILTLFSDALHAGSFKKSLIDSAKFNLKIIGNGKVLFQNITSNNSDTISSNKVISFKKKDSLSITVLNNSLYVFNGFKGVVTDTINLQNKKLYFKTDTSFGLDVYFAKRDSGYKKIQNELFDTTVLYNRASKNIMVWWDKRFDHDALSKDILKWSEWEWEKCVTEWGLKPPKGSDSVYINYYIHHVGNDVKNKDVFTDGWGMGVGTNVYKMPFMSVSAGDEMDKILKSPPYAILHETFHIMQYYATSNDNTFSYNLNENKFYVEATANYIQSYYGAKLIDGVDNTFLSEAAAFLMNPQLRLWHFPKIGEVLPWSRAVHGYAVQHFLLYLAWNNYITEDFIGKSFTSKSSLTAMEYLYKNIPNFATAYRNFVMNAAVIDFKQEFKPAYNYWIQNWSNPIAYKAATTLNKDDVNTFAFNLKDSSTDGFVRPKEKNQAWSYTTSKIVNTKKSFYRIQYKTDSVGSSKTKSNYYIGFVTQSSKKSNYQNILSYVDVIDRSMYIGKNVYASLKLTDGKCDTIISLEDSTIAYFVAISMPQVFTGEEIFDYQMSIKKLKDSCVNKGEPIFNTSKYSFCTGDSLKLSILNVTKEDSVKWYYDKQIDISNVSVKTFTETSKVYVVKIDKVGCVDNSDTINIIKNPIPSAPLISRDTEGNLVASAGGTIWFLNGVQIPDTAQKFKPMTSGLYTAKASPKGCLSPLSEQYYYLVNAIANLNGDEYIKVSPNPFKNDIFLDYFVNGYQRLNLEIYDITSGSKVYFMKDIPSKTRINLQQLPAGKYLIKVISADFKIIYQIKMFKM